MNIRRASSKDWAACGLSQLIIKETDVSNIDDNLSLRAVPVRGHIRLEGL